MRNVNPWADGCVSALVGWLGEFFLTCSGCLISPLQLPFCVLDVVYYSPLIEIQDRELLTFLLPGMCHIIVQTLKEYSLVCLHNTVQRWHVY